MSGAQTYGLCPIHGYPRQTHRTPDGGRAEPAKHTAQWKRWFDVAAVSQDVDRWDRSTRPENLPVRTCAPTIRWSRTTNRQPKQDSAKHKR